MSADTPPPEDSYEFFRRSDVVAEYSALDFLSAPEQRILELWESKLPGSRLLDVGIGGGRTTTYLAPRVGEYVGIDVSPEMVKATRERFARQPSRPVEIRLGDVRDLSGFSTGEFDLAFFSFNGLDSVGDHTDRIRALAELARVVRPGGSLAFSVNNLYFARWSSSFLKSLAGRSRWYPAGPKSWHPRHLRAVAKGARRWRRHNPGLRSRVPYMLVAEERVRFDFDRRHYSFPEQRVLMTMYWCAPSEQVRQLEVAGFEQPRIFAPDGSEVTDLDERKLARWRWLYYLANRR